MLTLVRQPQRTTTVLWDKVIRPCRRALERAAGRSQGRELDALSRLDDRLLADIGLTREHQILACSKLFSWYP